MGTERQINETRPWGGQRDYITRGLRWAEQWAGSHVPEYFPGSTVVDFSPYSAASIEARAQRGLQGSAQERALGGYLNSALGQNQVDLNPAIAQLQQTAAGGSLYGNPFLDAQYEQATRQMGGQFDRALSGVNATFGAGGRTGSGIHQQAVQGAAGEYARQLGDTATQIYGGNYQQERDRQMAASSQLGNIYSQIGQNQLAAAGMVPGYSNLQYQNINQLGQAGAMMDEQARAQLQDQINRWDFAQSAPYNQIQQYMNVVGQPYGTQSISYGNGGGGNAALSALGGAGTGASIGSAFGPWGTAIGAGVGALGGFIGGGGFG